MDSPFASIEDAIQEIRQGRMVVVVDDEDRENEGDLTLAAQFASPAHIAFMATHGRGLICAAMEGARLDELKIPLMVTDNTSRFETAFCVSVEAREGTTTGISAADRATTIQRLVDPVARPEDFVRPGHVFPLRAQPGGVLTRIGQTEAAVDLARLAGLRPAGVICEIMKDDGTMARVPDLQEFCRIHGLKLVTVADLVGYRLRREPLIERVESIQRTTKWGQVTIHRFRSFLDGGEHLAFVFGCTAWPRPPLVRVHLESLPDDLVGQDSPNSAFHRAMDLLQKDGCGILVYLRRHIHTAGVLDEGESHYPTEREIGIGAQILRDAGIREMRLLCRKETKYIGLKGFGLDICEYTPLEMT